MVRGFTDDRIVKIVSCDVKESIMKKSIKQEDVVSDLKMLDFYFSDITFNNKRIIANSLAKVSYNVENHPNEDGSRRVEVVVTVESEDCGIYLQVKAIGIFDATAIIGDPEKRDFMERIGPLTTMFPLIRTQIMLFTTQPGMSQLILPPIDAYKLVDQSEKLRNNN